jgi:hypothetical protein
MANEENRMFRWIRDWWWRRKVIRAVLDVSPVDTPFTMRITPDPPDRTMRVIEALEKMVEEE